MTRAGWYAGATLSLEVVELARVILNGVGAVLVLKFKFKLTGPSARVCSHLSWKGYKSIAFLQFTIDADSSDE